MLDTLPKDVLQKVIADKYLNPTDIHTLRLLAKHFTFLKLKPEDRQEILIKRIIKAAIKGIENYIAGYGKLPTKNYTLEDEDKLVKCQVPKDYPGFSKNELNGEAS